MIPQFNFPSLHLIGQTDKYFNNLKCHTLFTEESKPKVINFNEGHKFPRAIEDEDF